MPIEKLALLVAAFSAFAAAVAAIANFLQAKRASQANEVNVYIEMMKGYGGEEMRVAISSLAQFWRTNRDLGTVESVYLVVEKSDPLFAKELRGHCRILSAFFVNAARLYEAGLISKRLLKLLITHPGLNVFYEVANPINTVTNRSHNSRYYISTLKDVAERHGDGLY